MWFELEGIGVQVLIINFGLFCIGFNDCMYDMVDQWFESGVNFSDEGLLCEMQV